VITIKKSTVKDSGSCSACLVRATDPATGQWLHPNRVSWEILIGKRPGSGTMVHLCNECLSALEAELKNVLILAVLGAPNAEVVHDA